MNQCTFDAHEAADKVLNRVFKAATDGLKKDGAEGKETLKKLLASERAWIDYRDKDCELQGTTMLHGSGEGLLVGRCLYVMTTERAKSVDELFNTDR